MRYLWTSILLIDIYVDMSNSRCMTDLERLMSRTLERIDRGEAIEDIRRRWRRGQRAVCHCPCRPAGRAARLVVAGGRVAHLDDGRGGVHVCPTAILAHR